jgi:hypothetical protein
LSNNCEVVTDGVALALHHIAGFKVLVETLPIPGTSVLSVLLFVFLMLLFGYFLTLPSNSNQDYQKVSVQKKVFALILNPILKWISLHNKRDSHLSFK